MKYLFIISTCLIFSTVSCKQVKDKSNIEIGDNQKKIEKQEHKNDNQQINNNCFTSNNVKELKLFFESIKNNDDAYQTNSSIKFKQEDLIELKELLNKKSLDSFDLKYGDLECDPEIGVEFFYREKFEDDGEVHYSEVSEMYKILKKENILSIKFLATAG